MTRLLPSFKRLCREQEKWWAQLLCPRHQCMPGEQHLGCSDALNNTPISWICFSAWVQGIAALLGPGQRQEKDNSSPTSRLPLDRRAPW